MVRKPVVILGALLVAVACGGVSPQASAPTPATVAVQSSDLPKGMARCDLSGSIDSFLAKEKTADPNTYSSFGSEWADAKKNGAVAANTTFFADTSAHCADLRNNSQDFGGANYKLVVNFVIQFKDSASAAKGYTSESIFGFSSSQLKASAGTTPVQEGTATGLTANSIVLSVPVAGQSYFIAVWQNKNFMVILAVLNLDSASSKKVATAENHRIS